MMYKGLRRLHSKIAHFLVYRLLSEPLAKFILWVTVHKPRVFGAEIRLHIAQDAVVQNAMFNVMSGDVTVEGKVFFGHNVSLLTGTHDYESLGTSRMSAFPLEGRDILVKEGAWLASNVTVIGPCVIGRHAVVGACSLVLGDVPDFAIVAGVPARIVRYIGLEDSAGG
jgi:acetyltransferase-like isoleucine patch superfamily enzyme